MVSDDCGDCLVNEEGDPVVHWRSATASWVRPTSRQSREAVWFPDCSVVAMRVSPDRGGSHRVTYLWCLVATERPC